ncbi:MAG: hypothetical protein IJ121_01785 [Eubacterium sp.]|nr:hypothetical protein [Eubacterium sp.]
MMDQYVIQKVRECIATYFNLNGTRPCMQEMIEWTGESAETIRQVYMIDAGHTGRPVRAIAA